MVTLSFRLITPTYSFFAKAQRIVAEEYVPPIEDILHTTERGIKETYFKTDQSSIRILQVCLLGCERRKWIHQFESITSFMFYASLSDYDVEVSSWSEQTRLAESLSLFESVVNSRSFLWTSVILLLSDIAEFRTKIHEVPLARYYPEYTGGTDANEGAKFILRRFIELNRSGLSIYSHITEASDMAHMRMSF